MNSQTSITTLPRITEFTGLSPHARARAREGVNGGNAVMRGNAVMPPLKVTILRHCRCIDCQKFFKDAVGAYFCRDYIGGTVVSVTGERVCDPPPETWHYCAGYDGPQISKDIFIWKYQQGGESHANQ